MKPHISVSQINTFLNCPRAYSYSYEEEDIEPAHVSSPLILGQAVHMAAARLYIGIQKKERVKAREVAEAFCDYLLALRKHRQYPIRYNKGENFNSMLVMGMGLVACLFRETPRDKKIIEVDYEINVPLRNSQGQDLDIPLKGFLDKIVEEEGNPVVTDLKTSKIKYSAERISTDLQSCAYTYALATMNGGGPVKFVWEILLKNVAPKMQVCEVVRDTPDFDRFWAIAKNTITAIRAGAYYPVTSWRCKSCPYSYACGEWRG